MFDADVEETDGVELFDDLLARVAFVVVASLLALETDFFDLRTSTPTKSSVNTTLPSMKRPGTLRFRADFFCDVVVKLSLVVGCC